MNNLHIAQYMIGKSLFFKKEMTIASAVEILLANPQIGGPVLDDVGHVIGWLSEQDCLAKMLEASYHCELVALVEDVMFKEVLIVKSDMNVFDLGQVMLKNKPKIYPIVDENNLFIGLISRKHVLKAISQQLEDC
ncbi:signal transduction protein [Psychromonas sp. CNPT3]|uniref:CBS domain-containing protein n=1 Tax=Psychromonas sp. CNPT3 TaxID=314282 RepID=UPI00006E488D|nr:CBS domain-containing protein [Psychromonas sp. CNPT3]AGH80942.1 signal transduction protein [Psychromonas sp. CNPT3]